MGVLGSLLEVRNKIPVPVRGLIVVVRPTKFGGGAVQASYPAGGALNLDSLSESDCLCFAPCLRLTLHDMEDDSGEGDGDSADSGGVKGTLVLIYALGHITWTSSVIRQDIVKNAKEHRANLPIQFRAGHKGTRGDTSITGVANGRRSNVVDDNGATNRTQ